MLSQWKSQITMWRMRMLHTCLSVCVKQASLNYLPLTYYLLLTTTQLTATERLFTLNKIKQGKKNIPPDSFDLMSNTFSK